MTSLKRRPNERIVAAILAAAAIVGFVVEAWNVPDLFMSASVPIAMLAIALWRRRLDPAAYALAFVATSSAIRVAVADALRTDEARLDRPASITALALAIAFFVLCVPAVRLSFGFFHRRFREKIGVRDVVPACELASDGRSATRAVVALEASARRGVFLGAIDRTKQELVSARRLEADALARCPACASTRGRDERPCDHCGHVPARALDFRWSSMPDSVGMLVAVLAGEAIAAVVERVRDAAYFGDMSSFLEQPFLIRELVLCGVAYGLYRGYDAARVVLKGVLIFVIAAAALYLFVRSVGLGVLGALELDPWTTFLDAAEAFSVSVPAICGLVLLRDPELRLHCRGRRAWQKARRMVAEMGSVPFTFLAPSKLFAVLPDPSAFARIARHYWGERSFRLGEDRLLAWDGEPATCPRCGDARVRAPMVIWCGRCGQVESLGVPGYRTSA